MAEWTVYLNGRYVPESEAHVSIFDRGLMHGDTVYDVTRTFNQRPFRLREHVERLYRSLRYVRIPVNMSIDEMEAISQQIVERNTQMLAPNDDVHIRQVITRGDRRAAQKGNLQPTVIVYCEPVPFWQYAHQYREGAHLVSVSIRRVPPSCLSTQSKIANKMPLILGEFEARQRDPDAYAAFLNLEGFITESTSANILLVRGDRIYSPRRHGILEGISRSAVFGLARRIGKVMVEDDLTVFDAMNADEVLLTATSFCVLPVCQFDGVSIGEGKPGPTSQVLLEAWSAEVGVDIVGQALAHLPGSGARPEFDAGAVR